jgi:hypothetical protein
MSSEVGSAGVASVVRRSIRFPAIQNPARNEIVRMTLPPALLLLPPAGDLAIRVLGKLVDANQFVDRDETTGGKCNRVSFGHLTW